MPGYRSADGIEAVAPLVQQAVAAYPTKFWWFAQRGYRPHTWQILFHGAHGDDKLVTNMRHLVAGRRGGKTLSAAWETLFYALHPSEYWRDFQGVESNDPLWIWILSKSYKTVRPALLAFIKALNRAGLVKGKDYDYNKTERTFEFPDGTLVEFKTADDPDNLRGAGLHLLWIDEAAVLPSKDAWETVSPGLGDVPGGLITTTTPKGRNWFYDEFWVKMLPEPNQFRVEYTSLDNPHFKKSVWDFYRRTYHPLMFRQEFMASFDAMAGVALSGEWLRYYVLGRGTQESDDDITLIPVDGKLNLATYLAIDPATGEGDDAFAMVLVGVDESTGQGYVLDTYKDSEIKFPEQIEKIQEWAFKYRPRLIGVEAVAFQRVIVQQLQRIPGMPTISAVFTKGKKPERILAMSPLFRMGRVRIHRRHRDFIDQWVSYDPPPPFGTGSKAQKDDLLDATEIALGLAGILLPRTDTDAPLLEEQPVGLQAAAHTEVAELHDPFANRYDPELGAEFF